MKFEKLYFEDPKDLFLSIYYTIYVPDGEVHCLGSQEFFPRF